MAAQAYQMANEGAIAVENSIRTMLELSHKVQASASAVTGLGDYFHHFFFQFAKSTQSYSC